MGIQEHAAAEAEVLVAGAGPAGLTVAVELARRGIGCRLVDREPAPQTGTRGCTVWQRTLEVLDLMGVAVPAFQAQGRPFRRRRYHLDAEELGAVDVAEPASPYPLPVIVSQQTTERVLTDRLAELGGRVERGVAVESVRQLPGGVHVLLRHRDGRPEGVDAGWLVAAQGSRSNVRDQLGIGWPGRAFGGLELLQVDARVGWPLPLPADEAALYFAPGGHLGCLPMAGGRHRLFMVHRTGAAGGTGGTGGTGRGEPPRQDELTRLAARITGAGQVRLADARFALRVRLQNRVATAFRNQRCLLAGDSARVFAPVAAQGMNTGIQDAFNLGWKLAAVLRGAAGEALLDTYQAERYPVAQALLERTERSLRAGTAARPDRAEVLAGIARQRAVRTELSLSYPGSPLSADHLGAPGPRAGDRVPDAVLTTAAGPTSVFRLLRDPRWALLVTAEPAAAAGGAPVPGAVRALAGRYPADLAVHLVAGDLGARDRLYLIRPDGYLAFRGAPSDAGRLDGYLRRTLR